jgi:hypothetical protein
MHFVVVLFKIICMRFYKKGISLKKYVMPTVKTKSFIHRAFYSLFRNKPIVGDVRIKLRFGSL